MLCRLALLRLLTGRMTCRVPHGLFNRLQKRREQFCQLLRTCTRPASLSATKAAAAGDRPHSRAPACSAATVHPCSPCKPGTNRCGEQATPILYHWKYAAAVLPISPFHALGRVCGCSFA